MTPERRTLIQNTVSDLIGGFLYYDRKEDEDLPRGSVEEAIRAGEITIVEILAIVEKELEDSVDSHPNIA